MEQSRLDLLLRKHENAETTLAEERELKRYFANTSNQVADQAVVFRYFEQEKSVTMKSAVRLPPKQKKKSRVLPWLAAAAVVAMVGVGFLFNQDPTSQKDLGTYNNPEMAYEQTQQALSLLSGKMNIGINQVQYASEYNETTGIIFND